MEIQQVKNKQKYCTCTCSLLEGTVVTPCHYLLAKHDLKVSVLVNFYALWIGARTSDGA